MKRLKELVLLNVFVIEMYNLDIDFEFVAFHHMAHI